jgi:hypothetical protein
MKKTKRFIVSVALITMALAISAQAVQRLVLLEMQTNTSCPGCYNADLLLDELTHEYSEYFVAIRYHAWWPSSGDPYYQYNISENTSRINYYPPHPDGYRYTPYAWIGGIIRGGYSYNSWWNYIQGRYTDDSPLEITLDGVFGDDSREGILNITIEATNFIEWSNIKVRIALIESNIYWHSPNGTDWHHQTMRDMIPSVAGTPIDISQGDTLELSQDFTCPSPLVPRNCQLVVFVQSDNGKEVLQTAQVWLDNLDDPVSVDDDITGIPSRFELAQNYPNPFNTRTAIDYIIEKRNWVELSIYDLNGRKVTTLVNAIQESGHHQAIWDGTDRDGNELSSGVYFYRLVSGSESIGRRMVLLK